MSKLFVIVGDSASGKSTLARIMEAGFRETGRPVTVLDGVEPRHREGLRAIMRELGKKIDGYWQTVIVTCMEPLPQEFMDQAERVIEISRPRAFARRRALESEGILRRIFRKVFRRFV